MSVDIEPNTSNPSTSAPSSSTITPNLPTDNYPEIHSDEDSIPIISHDNDADDVVNCTFSKKQTIGVATICTISTLWLVVTFSDVIAVSIIGAPLICQLYAYIIAFIRLIFAIAHLLSQRRRVKSSDVYATVIRNNVPIYNKRFIISKISLVTAFTIILCWNTGALYYLFTYNDRLIVVVFDMIIIAVNNIIIEHTFWNFILPIYASFFS